MPVITSNLDCKERSLVRTGAPIVEGTKTDLELSYCKFWVEFTLGVRVGRRDPNGPEEGRATRRSAQACSLDR